MDAADKAFPETPNLLVNNSTQFKTTLNNTNMEEQKLNINLSPEMAEGSYSNLAIVAHSSSEFVVDFVRMMPGQKSANVQSRIIMTPENTKKLLFALQENIAKYEKQFGTIKLNGTPAPGSTIPMSFGGGQA